MKNHIKNTGVLLLYTVAFNVISFVFYFMPAFFHQYTFGPIFVLLEAAQICFTVVYFSKILLPKFLQKSAESNSGMKADLIIYFIVLCIFSVLIVPWRFNADSWFTYIFFNTFYPLAISFNFLDNIAFFIVLYIAENAIKTYCLYKNTVKKVLSKTAIICLSVATGVLYIIFLVLTGLN